MTRKEAINVLLNEKECVLRETCERLECASCELVMPVGNILSAYDVAIDALREQEERWWIPVTERLPESGGTYIVRSDRGSIYTSHFYPPRKSRIGIYGGNWTPRGKTTVTHWMPLPELPKEV